MEDGPVPGGMDVARYLVVNPVGTDAWDAQDAAYLSSLAAPGDEVHVASLRHGPPSVDTEARLVEAECGVAELLGGLASARVAGTPHSATADGGETPEGDDGLAGYDAVVINCFADPGLSPGRELMRCPVLGAGETALALAPLFGDGVALLAPDEGTAGMFNRYARRLGLQGTIAGVFPVGVTVADLERDPERTVERVAEQAGRAHRQAGSRVVVLGCTGLAPLAPRIASRIEGTGLVVLEPMALSFRAAEVLVRLGVSHFRGGLYAPCSWPGEAAVPPAGTGGRASADPDPVVILLVNAVVSAGLLEWVPEYARSAVPPWTRVEVRNIDRGPECIETFCQESLARPAVVQGVRSVPGPFDASVVNCCADPAVRALREVTGRPAIGPGEASCRLAVMLGHRFGVVSTGRNAAPWVESQVREMGLGQRLAGVAGVELGVLSLSRDEAATGEAIVSAARDLVERAGAEVIALGCTGMAKVARQVSRRLGVPVLEPLAVALNLADLVVRARPWRKRQGGASLPDRQDARCRRSSWKMPPAVTGRASRALAVRGRTGGKASVGRPCKD